MTDNNEQTHCCIHYPNRVLQRRDLAVELGGVSEKTVDNLVKAGKLPQPCRLNSIQVWMLYDVHAFLSAAVATPRTGAAADTTDQSDANKRKAAKRATQKAGKFSV